MTVYDRITDGYSHYSYNTLYKSKEPGLMFYMIPRSHCIKAVKFEVLYGIIGFQVWHLTENESKIIHKGYIWGVKVSDFKKKLPTLEAANKFITDSINALHKVNVDDAEEIINGLFNK